MKITWRDVEAYLLEGRRICTCEMCERVRKVLDAEKAPEVSSGVVPYPTRPEGPR